VREPVPASTLPKGGVIEFARTLDRFAGLRWHRNWEALPLTFTVWVVVAVVVASLFEIVPMFSIRSDIPRIASVTPYTPLELVGRAHYISEGCVNCHSQMVRPLVAETERYGEYSKPGESVFDHPFLWGSRRIGPDLAREGVRNPSALWHLRHFNNPVDTSPGSIMPAYPHMLEKGEDYAEATRAVSAMRRLGVAYSEADERGAADAARAQAALVMAQLVKENGKAEGVSQFADRRVIAVIAYLQRLGTDLNKPVEAAPAVAASTAGAPQAHGGME
jgi:cytochrome c oxidase cbb3-type subunit I/II